MSILITGGCGYIGSHTCIEMLKAGFDIVVLDNYYNAKPEALRRVKELAAGISRFMSATSGTRRVCGKFSRPTTSRRSSISPG